MFPGMLEGMLEAQEIDGLRKELVRTKAELRTTKTALEQCQEVVKTRDMTIANLRETFMRIRQYLKY